MLHVEGHLVKKLPVNMIITHTDEQLARLVAPEKGAPGVQAALRRY